MRKQDYVDLRNYWTDRGFDDDEISDRFDRLSEFPDYDEPLVREE